MCGICGIAHTEKQRPVDVARLTAMRDLLAHRGPDDAGLWHAPGAGLAHRRLSIIDLEGGHQPLSNEDGTVWVTFNGEIYNYRDLAHDLVQRGHVLRTRSDTEVLVHAYEEFGVDFASRLNGIFALGLYDTARSRLLLVRDQLGVKPLFFAVRDGAMAFASEIKAVLAGLDLESELRFEALQEYLVFRYVSGDRSFFRHVHRLPPGHLAIWEGGALQIRPFWTPPREPPQPAQRIEEATEQLDNRLRLAVERQMMSDVPLGAFCSGGVDSGLITGYAAALSGHRLRTFAVGFADRSWDESALALDTATRFDTDHQTIESDPTRFQADLSKLIWYNDEPLSHPNSVPLYHLSKLARQSVKVVLTGEGADELFCGYPRYQIARLRHAARFLPTQGRALLGKAMARLPDHRARKLARLISLSVEQALLFNSAFVDPGLVGKLTGSPVSESLASRLALVNHTALPDDPAAWISRYELLTYLVSALDRIDRMSMAVGLEARVPFLDIELVEWGVLLASALKLRGHSTKHVVRKLAARSLSPRIAHGAKSGFGLPLDSWFRRPEYGPLVERMSDGSHPAADYFDGRVLARVLREHREGTRDHGELLWLLANVYLWCEAQQGASGRP
jgi:asparagine synthase (glutamine-hydrolysing)